MKKLIVTMWITLDGFIANTNNNKPGLFGDPEMDWVLGDDEMSDYEINVVSNADILLLGRKTYQDFAGYWPKVPDNPEKPEWEKAYAGKLNALKKIVISEKLEKAEWSESRIMREIVPEEIEKLKNESEKSILIYGSASIVRQLTNLGLIDEYQLLVHPAMLGSGKPLFEDRVNLQLVKTEPFKSGVVLLTYQLAAK